MMGVETGVPGIALQGDAIAQFQYGGKPELRSSASGSRSIAGHSSTP